MLVTVFRRSINFIKIFQFASIELHIVLLTGLPDFLVGVFTTLNIFLLSFFFS